MIRKLKTIFRGDIPIYHLPHEAIRRRQASVRQEAERNTLDALNRTPARLSPEFAKYSSEQMLEYFRTVERPSYGLKAKQNYNGAISAADQITDSSTWELMGFGPMRFDADNVWRRDPISGHDWGLQFHTDVELARDDGSDIRVLWELNRLGHLLNLATAFEQTENEEYAETFFSHVEAWTRQNPYARGANWNCAMEAALRVCNVLAAFQTFRRSTTVTPGRLELMLTFFDHHGRFILDNNEFSYIATSNHYLSDVIGLFWIGVLVPELAQADEWRKIGFRELLREVDKQVLPDGADFESSTGYHRFVTEMCLHTFILAKQNGIDIADTYWKKLEAMLDFLQAITRPDGKMPVAGDCDGSRFLPFEKQNADDSQFLLDLAGRHPIDATSAAFPDAGIYVLRNKDLYLHFNASDCGLNGRGSHGHNDALSIEVFAHGRPFIVDPGSYAYNLDLEARHLFRSTAYHSTVGIDDTEQNTISRELPFVIGNEAAPKVRERIVEDEFEMVRAEHYGYRRLKDPVIHSRTVLFDEGDGTWRITDEFSGRGEHKLTFNFHLAPGVDADLSKTCVRLFDEKDSVLRISARGILAGPVLRDSFFAPNYGERLPTKILTWETIVKLPHRASFGIDPR